MVTFITLFSSFTLAFESVFPATIFASVATYFPSEVPFFTSIVKLSINLLYPFGAFVSVMVIVSVVDTFVISTVPKFNIPFVVVPVLLPLCPGNV